MNRRKILYAFGAGVLAAPLRVMAQVAPGRIPRIGLLSAAASAGDFPERHTLEALRKLGWIDGKNLIIERRFSEGDPQRLIRYASELVHLNVDAILTFSSGVGVAIAATTTIPIVFGTSQNPVGMAYVTSLARPGRNVTGATFLTDELSAKRLELLKESIPGISRVAVLWEPSHVDNEFRGMQAVAPKLGIELQSVEVPRPARPDEVERAIQAAVDGRTRAIVLAPGGFTILNRKKIIDLAVKHRVPVISAWSIFADDGALLTYGPNLTEISQRVAGHVDRILKGANPAELPVEQPTKFELVVNLNTAQSMGIAIPRSTLIRADRTIA